MAVPDDLEIVVPDPNIPTTSLNNMPETGDDVFAYVKDRTDAINQLASDITDAANGVVGRSVLPLTNTSGVVNVEVGNYSSPPSIPSPPSGPSLDVDPPPVVNLDYSEELFTSPLLDSIQLKLLTDLIEGVSSLTGETEDAMFNIKGELEVLDLADAKDKLASDWSDRGLASPDGTLVFSLLNLESQYMEKKLEKSRTVVDASLKVLVDNNNHSVQASVQLESMLEDYFSGVNERALSAVEAQVKTAVRAAEAYARAARTLADIAMAEARAMDAEIDAMIAIARANLMMRKVAIKLYVGELEVNGRLLTIIAEETGLGIREAGNAAKNAALLTSHIQAAIIGQHHTAFMTAVTGEIESVSNIGTSDSDIVTNLDIVTIEES